MIAEVRFIPNGGGVWYPTSFRDFVIKNVRDLPEIVLGYENGSPVQSKPDLVFIGSNRFVGMRAYTSEACVTMFESAVKIARVLDVAFPGVPHQVKVVHHSEAVEPLHYASYSISRLVLTSNFIEKHGYQELLLLAPKKGEAPAVLTDQWQELIAEFIRTRLENEFEELKGNLKVKVLSPMRWSTPIAVKNVGKSDKNRLAFAVRDIKVQLNALISSPIQIGALTSRGYGDLKRII